MKAMIFAAGLGTRLKPLTDTLPKALVPVGGKPLLWHVLRKLVSSGINETVVNVHHFADQIEDWLAAQPWVSLSSDEAGAGGGKDAALSFCEAGRVTVHVSDERDMLLETGGAVLHAKSYLEGCGSFLIHNVDILSDCNLAWFASQVREDALATLLVSPRKTRRYLLFEPGSMRLAGWTDTLAGRVRMADPSLDPSSCLPLAFSGIHIMSDRVFGVMEEYAAEKGLPADRARFPVTDFYLESALRHPIYGVCCDSLGLLDVGKLDALEPAEAFAARLQAH